MSIFALLTARESKFACAQSGPNLTTKSTAGRRCIGSAGAASAAGGGGGGGGDRRVGSGSGSESKTEGVGVGGGGGGRVDDGNGGSVSAPSKHASEEIAESWEDIDDGDDDDVGKKHGDSRTRGEWTNITCCRLHGFELHRMDTLDLSFAVRFLKTPMLPSVAKLQFQKLVCYPARRSTWVYHFCLQYQQWWYSFLCSERFVCSSEILKPFEIDLDT